MTNLITIAIAAQKMMMPMNKIQIIWLPLLIAVAAGCWILPSLGNGMLWEDEAQTALLARTTLRFGVPIAFDGPNSLSEEQGDDYGWHRLWKWHMWLPFYVLAGFFKLFGESTAIARLPFALFGVATVTLTYFSSRLLWRDLRSAVLAALLVLGCVPFVLLARQCRYYSPSMFFTLLMMDAYFRICDGFHRGWIVLTIAATLLFNCHFIYCIVAFGAIGAHAVIWNRRQWKPLFLAVFMTAILCIAPFLWVTSLNYRNYNRVRNWSFFWFQLSTYIRLTFTQIVPYPLLVIPLLIGLIALVRQRSIQTIARLDPWAWPALFVTILVLVAGPFTPWPWFRYLGPAIAPLLILVSRWIVIAFRTHWMLGGLSLLLVCFWWPENKYLYEIQHPFVGPVEGIVSLLRAKGHPGDVVVASYEDMPLKFYTSFRIFGGVTGEDLSEARGVRWLIPRKLATEAVRAFIKNEVEHNPNYRPIYLNVPDIEWENREEPADHLFASPTGDQPVIVYELQPKSDQAKVTSRP